MTLILTVATYRGETPQTPMACRFEAAAGTIGRSDGSDLSLPDPDRYISRTHARVELQDGTWLIQDCGSNASVLNGRALGGSRQARLAHGDTLVIGEYVLAVAVEQPAAAPAPKAAVLPPVGLDDLLNDAGGASLPDPLAGIDPGKGSSEAWAGHDPLGLGLGRAGGDLPDPVTGQAAQPREAWYGSMGDTATPQHLSFAVPGLGNAPSTSGRAATPTPPSMIPEDFDFFGDTAPADPPQPYNPPELPALPEAAASAPAPAPAPIPAPVQALPAALPSADPTLQALLKGLGMHDVALGARSGADLAELVGQMLHEALGGTMGVLLARAITKKEIRMDMTVIGVRDNNPLKFFPDVDSALTQMLTGRGAGYLPPLKAIWAAFDDIKAHELAMVAGMRAALMDVLKRFSPDNIEKRLGHSGGLGGLLAGNRKARMWDRMVEMYGDMVKEADDDFQRLFGDRFSAAYDEQVARLRQQ